MRTGAIIVIIGWSAFLAFWLLLLFTAPLGKPKLQDWLMTLVPLSGIAVSYLGALFWFRGHRLIGGVAMTGSIIGLLWMMTGLLNAVSVLSGPAPS